MFQVTHCWFWWSLVAVKPKDLDNYFLALGLGQLLPGLVVGVVTLGLFRSCWSHPGQLPSCKMDAGNMAFPIFPPVVTTSPVLLHVH